MQKSTKEISQHSKGPTNEPHPLHQHIPKKWLFAVIQKSEGREKGKKPHLGLYSKRFDSERKKRSASDAELVARSSTNR